MDRRALPFLVVAFLAACGLALWLTRESAPKSEPEEVAAEVSGSGAPMPFRRQHLETRGMPGSPPSSESAPPPAASPVTAKEPIPSQRSSTVPAAARPTQAAQATTPDPANQALKEEVRLAVQEVTPLILKCFEHARDRFPPPQDVALNFTIKGQGISGHLDEGTIESSTVEDPWVQTCFLDAVSTARFPIPQGGRTLAVTIPITFRASPPDGGTMDR